MKNEEDCKSAGIEAAATSPTTGRDVTDDAPDDACGASSENHGAPLAGDYRGGDGVGEGAQKSHHEENEHMLSDECESTNNMTQGNETATVTTMTSGADTPNTDTIMATVLDASHLFTTDERSGVSVASSSNTDEDTALAAQGSQNNNFQHHDDVPFRPPPTSVESSEERMQRKIPSRGDDSFSHVGTDDRSASSGVSAEMASSRETFACTSNTQPNLSSDSPNAEIAKPANEKSDAVSQDLAGNVLNSDIHSSTTTTSTNDAHVERNTNGPSSLHSRLVGSLQLASPTSATDPPSRETSDEDAQPRHQQLDVGGTMITSAATLYQNGVFTRPGAYRIDPVPSADNDQDDVINAFDDGNNNTTSRSSGAAPPPTRLRRSSNIPDGQNTSDVSTVSTSHHGSSSLSRELQPAEAHTNGNDHSGQAPIAVPVGASAPIEASLVVDPLHIVSVHDGGDGWKGRRNRKWKKSLALAVVCAAIVVGVVLGVVLGNKKSNGAGGLDNDAQLAGPNNDQRPPLPILEQYKMTPLPSPPIPADGMNGKYFQQSIVQISSGGRRVFVASPQVSLGLKESSDFVGTTPSGSNGVVQVFDAFFQNPASDGELNGEGEIDKEVARPFRNEYAEGATSTKAENEEIRGSATNAGDRGNANLVSGYHEQYRFSGQPIAIAKDEAHTVPTQFGDAGDGIVGHAFDSDEDGNGVAISFMQRFTQNHKLGAGSNPGVVRVFTRNATDNSWRQLGNDIQANEVHRFGASVGLSLSPMSGGRLVIGSEDGTARAYRMVGDLSASEWERVDNGLLDDLEKRRGSKVSVAMTTIGRRFVVGYPDSNLVRMYKFDDDSPNGPSIIKLGPDLKGTVSDDGFGHSVSINLRGEFVVVGSKSGRYVQPFVIEEEKDTGTIDRWLHLPPIYSEVDDGNTFGFSVSAGRANPRHNGPVKGRPYTPDGQRIVVGSPEYGGGRGRAVVYQFNSRGQTWYRVGKQATGRDKFSRLGHSVSLSAQSLFVAASSGAGIASSQGEVQLFKLEETGP